MPGVERIWLPGEQSHERRQRYQSGGIPVVNQLVTELQSLARELGIAPLL
jgi:LDH2 family malate/lactate/ureidoglycolate dehydrogenase